MKVNRIKDYLERVGWTAIQAAAALTLDDLVSGHVVVWQAVLIAAAIASLKVVTAQQFGTRGSGDAIPGGVIEPKVTA